MSHDGTSTPHWQSAVTGINNFLKDDKYKNFRNLLGTMGSIASTEKGISDLKKLPADARKEIFGGATGYGGGLFGAVKETGDFIPFSVTAGPGKVETTKDGSLTYTLDQDQKDLETSLRTGGSTVVDALLGRGRFGRARTDAQGNLVRDAQGNIQYDQDLRADQGRLLSMIEGTDIDPLTLRRTQTLDPASGEMVDAPSFRDSVDADFQRRLVDPYGATARSNREQTFYDRLQALRTPDQQREQAELASQLAAQGRTGVRTNLYGGTPEELALAKAIEEQKAQDAVTAIGLARDEADTVRQAELDRIREGRAEQEARAGRTLSGLRQQVDEKLAGAEIASRLLRDSYLGMDALSSVFDRGRDSASLADVARRQLAGYQRDMGSQVLDYDLGIQENVASLRQQQLQSLINLLIAEENRKAAASGINPSAMNTGNVGQPGNAGFRNFIPSFSWNPGDT